MKTAPTGNTQGRKFLGIHFIGCNVYGRLYANKENTHYVGRCPKCGTSIRVKIGTEGTSDRFFMAHCQMNHMHRTGLR